MATEEDEAFIREFFYDSDSDEEFWGFEFADIRPRNIQHVVGDGDSDSSDSDASVIDVGLRKSVTTFLIFVNIFVLFYFSSQMHAWKKQCIFQHVVHSFLYFHSKIHDYIYKWQSYIILKNMGEALFCSLEK